MNKKEERGIMKKEVSRREFLKGAAVSAAAVATAGLLQGCSNTTSSPDEGEYTFADVINWTGKYDVVVIGFGAAGATAAIAAAEEGAKVLVVDKAPRHEAGGNSRICHQLFATVTEVH